MSFLKKIFSPTILIFSLTLLIYTLYRSEIIYAGNKRNYYSTYYTVSIFLIFFSITTFYISAKIKEYLIIILLSSIVSLFIFEGYLTYKINKKYRIYEKFSGKKWDRRTPVEIYNDLKKEDNQIAMSIRATLHETENYSIFSLGGISNSKTIHCNENGYYSIYNSDRHGFNNPDKEWDSKEIEYLLVGDSFTHGSCVNRPNDIGSILRNLSNNKSVLNLGYRGNGPLTEYATLREYLTPNVKKVLWVYYANDLSGLTTEKNQKILNNYFNDTSYVQNIKLKQNLIDENIKKFITKYEKRLKKKEKKSIKKEFIKLYNLRIFFKSLSNEKMLRTISQEFKSIIKLAHDYVKKNQSNFYFVYIPEYKRYKKNLQNDYSFNDYEKVINYVKNLNIPVIDLNEELFQKNKDPLSLYPFRKRAAGFSPEINVIVTDIIHNKIKQKN